MGGTTLLKEPLACTEGERREFARLVRRGFNGSDKGLNGRIRNANRLAFYYVVGDVLAGIAALKLPGAHYREGVFEKAGLAVTSADYECELGWVFVDAAHRGNRIAESLCRQLLAKEPAAGVFATTRVDNDIMIRILLVLGFERAGKPYSRRNEELVVFLRS